jgi:hypothetical protein
LVVAWDKGGVDMSRRHHQSKKGEIRCQIRQESHYLVIVGIISIIIPPWIAMLLSPLPITLIEAIQPIKVKEFIMVSTMLSIVLPSAYIGMEGR